MLGKNILTKVGSFGIFSFFDREVTMIIDIVPAIKTFILGLNQIHYAMGRVSKN
jgi:hypothetical protein